MKRKVGTKAYAIRTPIIKEGDRLETIAYESIMDAKEFEGFNIDDRDIVAITESLLARSQGNYVDIDEVSESLNKYFKDEISVVFPILSRNRFSLIMKAIANTKKKIKVFLSYPNDEVGNSIVSKFTFFKKNINIYKDTLSEKEFREIAKDEIYHPFTGMDYLHLYKSYNVDGNIEIFVSNNLDDIAEMSSEILICNIHEREFLSQYFKDKGIENVYSIKDIMSEPINGSKFNEEYGLYGSNLSGDRTLKLFPRNSQEFVEKLQKIIYEKTGKNVEVMIYGDGAFKDPVGHIWELADPVVSPGYTKGLVGLPNEIKLKYVADNESGSKAEIEEKIRDRIKEKEKDLKGKNESLGTTPRQITDLVGSLADLMSGSGDKGTPLIYIKGYFDNFASE